mgnify:CR=1 FL=1
MEIKMKQVRKTIYMEFRIFTTLVLVVRYFRLVSEFEYLQELRFIDNLIGLLPFILITSVFSFVLVLIWVKHQGFKTSTIVLLVLTVLGGLLLIPAVDGSFHKVPSVTEEDTVTPDLSSYEPFSEDAKLEVLPQPASLQLDSNLPKINGEPTLYPLYAALVQAAYAEETYSSDVAVYSSNAQAFKELISGEREIIFSSGWPTNEHVDEAKEAGVDLTVTEIGKDAVVFLVGASNPIDGLTKQQLNNIYSGKTTKWKTLGWEEGGTIVAYQRPNTSESHKGVRMLLDG